MVKNQQLTNDKLNREDWRLQSIDLLTSRGQHPRRDL